MLFRKFICGLLKFFGIQTTYCCDDPVSTLSNPLPRVRDGRKGFDLLFYAPYPIVGKANIDPMPVSFILTECAELLLMKCYNHDAQTLQREAISSMMVLLPHLERYDDEGITRLEMTHCGCQVTGGVKIHRVFFWKVIHDILHSQSSMGTIMGRLNLADGSYLDIYQAMCRRATAMQQLTAQVVIEARGRIAAGANPEERIYVMPWVINIKGVVNKSYKVSSSFPRKFADSIPVSNDCWLSLHEASELPI